MAPTSTMCIDMLPAIVRQLPVTRQISAKKPWLCIHLRENLSVQSQSPKSVSVAEVTLKPPSLGAVTHQLDLSQETGL